MPNSLPTMVVPFATGRSTPPTLTCTPNKSSTTERCCFIGFGDCNTGTTTANTYNAGYGYDMETGESTQIIDPTGNTCFSFRVGTDITSVNIYMDILITTAIATNYFTTGSALNIYVAIAICDSDSNIFTVIPGTKTFVPLLPATAYPVLTCKAASQTNIPVEISKGSRIAIVAGLAIDDSTAPGTSFSFNRGAITGGVALY